MLPIGGKGGGIGQLLAAVAAALLLRLFSSPGPAIVPENEDAFDDDGERGSENDEATITGKVLPVTIRWSNITCSLSDKSTNTVSESIAFFFSEYRLSLNFR